MPQKTIKRIGVKKRGTPKDFEGRLDLYLSKLSTERTRLGLVERTVIAFPNGKPGIIGKLAVWLLRGSGAQFQTEYRDKSHYHGRNI